ncbi:MAG: tyrosine recombinase XerC [Gammaproteobacteria bacterium]|nr:tyrosine recombinase XerC [Gammaproteobacteria bacterium]
MVELQKIKHFIHFLKNVRHYSVHTQKAYARDLHKLGDFLTDEDIHNWDAVTAEQLNLFSMRLYHGGINPKSINRCMSSVRSFFKFLEHDIGKISTPKTTKKLPSVLSCEQFKLMAKPNSNDWLMLRDVAMIELLYSCGLRVSELVGLDIKDIDTDFLTVLGKGGKMRTTPIGTESYQALNRYLKKSEHNNKAVFINQNGQRLSVRWVQKMVKNRAQQVGIAFHVHPHMLRHAAATHFLQSSHDLRSVQAFLGHESIKSTQVYTHLDFLELSKVYDKCHPRAKK